MSEEETTIINKVAERLTFFFSNANLRTDKFLRNEVQNKQNNGFVTIDVLLRFNTIKKITTDAKLIAKAVGQVEELKLKEDESAIARVNPFSDDMMSDHVKVTLRVSNIPTKETDNGPDYDVTREELSAIFQEYGNVAMVRLLKSKMRGHADKIAVGRGFVEFHSLEDMEKAVAELCVEDINDESLKPKKVLTVKGNELKVKTMKQWIDKREALKAERGEKPFERDNQKKNRAEKRKAEEEADKLEIEAVEFKLDWKKGCVISIKGLPDDCDREAILASVKGFMGDDVTVRADYSRGQKDGAVRFDEPTDKIAALATELTEGKITIGSTKVESASVLEGEAEQKYYDDYIAFRTSQMRANAKEKQERKKRRGGGGRGGGRGRGRGYGRR
jgi:RNA recognition motif-containing protein